MSSPAASALRSAPAQNARSPAPVKTITRTVESVSAASSAAPMASATTRLMLLRARGRLIVIKQDVAALFGQDVIHFVASHPSCLADYAPILT